VSVFRFAASFVLGFAFFLLPIPVGERFTVPFDLIVQRIVGGAPGLVGLYFIAVLSISRLIFFSAVAPMMIDMFRKIPIRARELIAIFLMRTAVLIPVWPESRSFSNGPGF